MICEQRLIQLCNESTFVWIYHVADLYNANRLREYCQWFQRIHPQVNELLNSAHEEEAKGADFSNVSIHLYLRPPPKLKKIYSGQDSPLKNH